MKAQLYHWPHHWLVIGHIPENRPHRHISASLLIGLEGAFDVQVEGQWLTTKAMLVAPEVEQALRAKETPVLIFHGDPDSPLWLRCRQSLNGQPARELALPDTLTEQCRPLLQGDGDCRAAEQFLQALEAELPGPASDLDPRVAEICRHLRKTLPERIDVAELAGRVHLSSSRLTHLFKADTGVTLQRFLLHLKVSRALGLWRPGMSLSAVSAEAGFYDQPHLARTARTMFDALPSSFTQRDALQIHHC
jgi:AraC-like DNA-binding protein